MLQICNNSGSATELKVCSLTVNSHILYKGSSYCTKRALLVPVKGLFRVQCSKSGGEETRQHIWNRPCGLAAAQWALPIRSEVLHLSDLHSSQKASFSVLSKIAASFNGGFLAYILEKKVISIFITRDSWMLLVTSININ